MDLNTLVYSGATLLFLGNITQLLIKILGNKNNGCKVSTSVVRSIITEQIATHAITCPMMVGITTRLVNIEAKLDAHITFHMEHQV